MARAQEKTASPVRHDRHTKNGGVPGRFRGRHAATRAEVEVVAVLGAQSVQAARGAPGHSWSLSRGGYRSRGCALLVTSLGTVLCSVK